MSNRLEPKQTQCCKREEQQVGRRQDEGGRKHVRRGDGTEGALFVAHLEVEPEKNQKYSVRLSIQTGCVRIKLQLSVGETISTSVVI